MKAAPRVLASFCLAGALLVAPTRAGIGSDWHPDPDGDGIPSSSDLCPGVYDPEQLDGDGDGIGDRCDPDVGQPIPGGAVSDLRAEHVTPFGAWLAFTSPHDTDFGWTVAIAWSTDPTELTTLAGFEAAYDRGDAIEAEVLERFGEKIRRPLILTGLSPSTTYYLAATELAWDGLVDQIGPLLEIETLVGPVVIPSANRPRLFTDPQQLAELQAFRAGGDSQWMAWETVMRPRAHEAATNPDNVYLARHYCASAALLHLVSGEPADLADALVLLDRNIVYWENEELTGNQYRWEDSHLALCLDLLWDLVPQSTRDRAVAAFLEDDEAHVDAGRPRLDDTDEFASTTRTYLLDGLAACSAAGIDPDLAARACAVLDEGLDLWFGIQLVKARRDLGFWAQSGGFLPDGTDYGQGTSRYWLHAFLALALNGGLGGTYSPWVGFDLVSLVYQALTPSRLGYLTAGDVEDFSYNFGVEDNSFQLELADAGLLALGAGVLDRLGDPNAAAWARRLARDLFPVEASADGLFHLLFGAAALPASDYRSQLPELHLDSGSGFFVDRTSWSASASLLFLRGGWNGVDHSHGDVGHFQLYRRGRWITHEAIGYDGPASTGAGHNVLLLPVPEGGTPGPPGQSRATTSVDRIRRVSSGSAHAAILLDSTQAYLPTTETARYYDAVQRALVWIRGDELGSPDVVVVADLVRRASGAPSPFESRWQLHLDEEPAIAGSRALVSLPAGPANQILEVTWLLPDGALASALPPEGPPDTYPAEIYTHRLVLEASTPSAEERFLVVLQASDGGSVQPIPSLVSSGGFDGAWIGTDLVLLPTAPVEGRDDGAGAFDLELATEEALRVFVAGLVPNAGYSVSAFQNGPNLEVAAALGGPFLSDPGGVLALSIDEERLVVPIDAPTPLFADGFESGDWTAWSGVSP